MTILILASTSPRRKDLLQSLRVEFTCESPDFEEKLKADEIPSDYVMRNALGKAQSIFSGQLIQHKKYEKKSKQNLVVIGADTVVVRDSIVLEKPKSELEAKVMLESLSGRSHQVMSGYCLCVWNAKTSECITTTEVAMTNVDFKKLKLNEIEHYIQSGDPMDKAGSYGIQGFGAYFVRSISGSHTNVMGLPLCEIHEHLSQYL